MKKSLTEKQKTILAYITRYCMTCGRSPSQEEIAHNTFVKHQANSRYYLNALARKGFILFIPYEPRGIKILMSEPDDHSKEDDSNQKAIAADACEREMDVSAR